MIRVERKVSDSQLERIQRKGSFLKQNLNTNSLYINFNYEFLTDFLGQEIGGDGLLNSTAVFLKNRAEVFRCSQRKNYNSSLGKYLEGINKSVVYDLEKSHDYCYLALYRNWIYTSEIAITFRGYQRLQNNPNHIELFSGGFHSLNRKFSLGDQCAIVYYDLESGASWCKRRKSEEEKRKKEILNKWLLTLELETY